jgi:hypothetical protein
MPLLPLNPQANYATASVFNVNTTLIPTNNLVQRGSVLPVGKDAVTGNTGSTANISDVLNNLLTTLATALVSRLVGKPAPAALQPPINAPQTSQLQQSLNPNNDPQLAELINLSVQDPEVATLMSKAAANGVTVRFGETEANVNGYFQPTGRGTGVVVLSDRLRNSPTLEALPTFIHEMVHAATPENGNSLLEEGVAEAFAETKAAELRNTFNVAPGRNFTLPNIPALIRERINLYARLEPELREDNGIVGDLQTLGISLMA